MTMYWAAGFRALRKQKVLLTILFIYQSAWGFALLLFLDSVVRPLMQRYPGGSLQEVWVHLYWAESQIQLFKTDVAHPYLWILLALITVKIVLTPLLHAGIYYSLRHTEQPGGYRLIQGIRQLSRPFLLYYLGHLLLSLVPLYWLAPYGFKLYMHSSSYISALYAVAPWLGGWLVYLFVLKLILTYIQLNRTLVRPFTLSLAFLLRYGLPALMLGASIVLLTGLSSLAAMMISWMGVGLLVLIWNQVYVFLRLVLKVWETAVHYHYFTSKISKS
jgi:hypothetical protein